MTNQERKQIMKDLEVEEKECERLTAECDDLRARIIRGQRRLERLNNARSHANTLVTTLRTQLKNSL